MNKSITTISRRSVLAGAAGLLSAPMVLRASRAAAKSNSLTMTGVTGSFHENVVKYVINPFTEETGIKVNFVPTPELAKVKAMLLTGNLEWDVINVDGTTAGVGSKQGFWEKLDPSMFDAGDLVIPPASDYVAWDFYTAAIAWDPKKYGPGKHPTNFAGFFDVKTFPGRRAMRPAPNGTLEAALLADGVAPKDIYPLDLDRAFKVLGRIKANIATWPATASQSISVIQSGEIDFTITYTNRVKATNDPGSGTPMACSFEQNLLYPDALSVLKGAPNKENAMKFIAYFLRPEVQARLCEQVGGVPISRKAATMLSADARKWQPRMGDPNNLFISSEYWTENYEAVARRLQEWILT